jgi:hypothetical protein
MRRIRAAASDRKISEDIDRQAEICRQPRRVLSSPRPADIMREETLFALCAEVGKSQTSLGRGRGVARQSITSLARRGNPQVSTMFAHAAAAGLRLRLVAHFPGHAPREVSGPSAPFGESKQMLRPGTSQKARMARERGELDALLAGLSAEGRREVEKQLRLAAEGKERLYESRRVLRVTRAGMKDGTRPAPKSIAALREFLGLKQKEVGLRLRAMTGKGSQSSVAGTEKSENPEYLTLAAQVAAMGGRLEALAALPSGEEVRLTGVSAPFARVAGSPKTGARPEAAPGVIRRPKRAA